MNFSGPTRISLLSCNLEVEEAVQVAQWPVLDDSARLLLSGYWRFGLAAIAPHRVGRRPPTRMARPCIRHRVVKVTGSIGAKEASNNTSPTNNKRLVYHGMMV